MARCLVHDCFVANFTADCAAENSVIVVEKSDSTLSVVILKLFLFFILRILLCLCLCVRYRTFCANLPEQER